MEIDNIIKEITYSPLFYFSSSSNELFHSNFWKWLSTLNEKETLKLFSDKKMDGKLDFKREHPVKNKKKEKSKIDLYISEIECGRKNESTSIVIENKLKDFPRIEQLNTIRSSFGDKTEYILVSLFNSDHLKFEGWNVISYLDIVKKLDPNKFTKDIYHIGIIEDYKKIIENFVKIVENEKLQTTTIYDFSKENCTKNKLFEKLDNIKLWEGYQKFRASHLISQFNNYKKRDNLKIDYKINRKCATINFFWEIDKISDHKIGICIEDNQYRYVVGGTDHKNFARKLLEYGIFFKPNLIKKSNQDFYTFQPSWSYLYKKISNKTYQDLFEDILNDFKGIEENIEKIRKLIPNN